MKRIEAVIRPEKLEVLQAQLENIGYPGLMVTKIEGHGKQGGIEHQFRGQHYKTTFISKVKVEIIAPDNHVKKLTDAIIDVCRSGSVGDGKIFVSDIANVIRIRTGEAGEVALT
jgi:nitrogen regulatory protein PII